MPSAPAPSPPSLTRRHRRPQACSRTRPVQAVLAIELADQLEQGALNNIRGPERRHRHDAHRRRDRRRVSLPRRHPEVRSTINWAEQLI